MKWPKIRFQQFCDPGLLNRPNMRKIWQLSVSIYLSTSSLFTSSKLLLPLRHKTTKISVIQFSPFAMEGCSGEEGEKGEPGSKPGETGRQGCCKSSSMFCCLNLSIPIYSNILYSNIRKYLLKYLQSLENYSCSVAPCAFWLQASWRHCWPCTANAGKRWNKIEHAWNWNPSKPVQTCSNR